MELEEYKLVTEKAHELVETINLWNPDLQCVKVIKILSDLGFTQSDLVKPSKLFSGGW